MEGTYQPLRLEERTRLFQIIMRHLAVIFAFSLVSMFSLAQTEPEYLMEIGAGAGMMSYEGDFNGSVLQNMQPSGALVFRRLLNPRQGFKAWLGYGKMKGSSAGVKTAYPGITTAQHNPGGSKVYEFNNSLVDFNAVYEYNFWPFGTGREYRGAKHLTPFIFGGIGMTYINGGGDNAFTANLPIGLGVKYKIGERLNLNIDWTMHFTMSDKLDGAVDPYTVKSTGIFKNRDCYSVLQVSITYSFKEKCRVCHNQDE